MPSISLLYAGLLGLLYLVLSMRVVTFRWFRKSGIGDDGTEEMRLAIRVHANFMEYVPLLLVLLWMQEAKGAPDWALHGIGGWLLLARISHALGLGRSRNVSVFRFFGSASTFTILGILSILSVALALGHPLL